MRRYTAIRIFFIVIRLDYSLTMPHCTIPSFDLYLFVSRRTSLGFSYFLQSPRWSYIAI